MALAPKLISPEMSGISSDFRPKLRDQSALRHASSGIPREKYMVTGENLRTLSGPVLYGRRGNLGYEILKPLSLSGIARIHFSEIRYRKGRLYKTS